MRFADVLSIAAVALTISPFVVFVAHSILKRYFAMKLQTSVALFFLNTTGKMPDELVRVKKGGDDE